MDTGWSAVAMRDITELMNAYRECSRNVWNVYFAKRENVGGSLDAFGRIRELLFDSLVVSELSYEGEVDAVDIPPPVLRVVPRSGTPILIRRLSGPGEAGYWDQEKNMVVGPDDITLEFVDYFDFSQVPVKDFHYYLCRILSCARHGDYEGREALLEVSDGSVFHDDRADVIWTALIIRTLTIEERNRRASACSIRVSTRALCGSGGS